jgi:hypothetical protein
MAPARRQLAHPKEYALDSETARAALRILLAFAIGVGLTYLAWQHIGTHLSLSTDIVGATTFADFDVYRYLYRFYDIALVLPVATALAYLILFRFGPLRAAPPVRKWPPLLEETGAIPDAADTGSALLELDHTEEVERLGVRQLFWVPARVGLPALAVAIEASVARSPHSAVLTSFSVEAALLYAAAVIVATITLGLRRRLRARPVDRIDPVPAAAGWISRSIALDLPAVNAIASIVVLPLLVVVSSSTTVTVSANGHVVYYHWFPAWLGALATAIVTLIVVRALLRADSFTTRLQVERRTLLIVVAPILLFMVTATIEGAQRVFSGFDDAQAMVGAQLTFGHGLWPWRDILLLHGFFYDDLYGAIGIWVLSATRWGSNSGQSLFVLPFTVVVLYGFIVYFARKNALLIIAGALAVVLGLLPGWDGTRYVLVPVVLILFDRVLRRGSWSRCLLLMVSVVFISIVTPEATLLMLGVLATLVSAEIIHCPRPVRFVTSFSRTIRCAVAGAGLIALWVIFLIATKTFSGFVTYYQTTVTGHQLWGAFSPQWSLTGDPWATVEFALPIALYLLTVCKVVFKLTQRTPWRPFEWVLVASSTPVLLFYEVVLDRMDGGHVNEVFQTLIPFVILWAMEFVRIGDLWFVRGVDRLARRWPSTPHFRTAVPVSLLAIVAIAAGSPKTVASWENIPLGFHAVVPVDAPSSLALGYTRPGAVDLAQVTDLRNVLDRYAGKNGPVFDFVNEMGVTYFLLNRVPGARFYDVSVAQTTRAQDLEVSDLERSRPHVVVFNDTQYGLPSYDGIWSMERNYIVSQYILDHYRPLLDTHGQLILLRNDLFKRARPYPKLSVPPVTSDLYFDENVPACDWGYTPNFLYHPSSRAAVGGVNLPVKSSGTKETVSMTGWAFDTPDDLPGQILVVSGGRLIASTVPNIYRPDVVRAIHTGGAAYSGFTIQFSLPPHASYRIFVLNADGSVTPLSSATSTGANDSPPPNLTTPNGVVRPQRIVSSEGHIESVSESLARSFTLTVPAGTDLSSFEWMEMRTRVGLGNSHIEVTDSVTGGASHVIALSTLASIGRTVFTRVGSCLQWHGYKTTTLTMLVSGPPTSFSVQVLK